MIWIFAICLVTAIFAVPLWLTKDAQKHTAAEKARRAAQDLKREQSDKRLAEFIDRTEPPASAEPLPRAYDAFRRLSLDEGKPSIKPDAPPETGPENIVRKVPRRVMTYSTAPSRRLPEHDELAAARRRSEREAARRREDEEHEARRTDTSVTDFLLADAIARSVSSHGSDDDGRRSADVYTPSSGGFGGSSDGFSTGGGFGGSSDSSSGSSSSSSDSGSSGGGFDTGGGF